MEHLKGDNKYTYKFKFFRMLLQMIGLNYSLLAYQRYISSKNVKIMLTQDFAWFNIRQAPTLWPMTYFLNPLIEIE